MLQPHTPVTVTLPAAAWMALLMVGEIALKAEGIDSEMSGDPIRKHINRVLDTVRASLRDVEKGAVSST